MRTETAIERARIAVDYYGLDLDLDYFVLENEEYALLNKLQKVTGYDGRNYLGRSKQRQFWYYLQWGWKKYQEQLRKGAH